MTNSEVWLELAKRADSCPFKHSFFLCSEVFQLDSGFNLKLHEQLQLFKPTEEDFLKYYDCKSSSVWWYKVNYGFRWDEDEREADENGERVYACLFLSEMCKDEEINDV